MLERDGCGRKGGGKTFESQATNFGVSFGKYNMSIMFGWKVFKVVAQEY